MLWAVALGGCSELPFIAPNSFRLIREDNVSVNEMQLVPYLDTDADTDAAGALPELSETDFFELHPEELPIFDSLINRSIFSTFQL